MAEHSPTPRPTGAKHLPAVTAGETASMLLPWAVEGPFPGQRETKKRHGFAAYANIVNRLGIYVAQGLPPEVAAGIVEAVNERAALRDLVRRLADELEGHYYAPESMDDPCIIREAREAIKEGEL